MDRRGVGRPTVASVQALLDIGWDEGWAASYAAIGEALAAACEPVRVVGVDRGAVDLIGADGAARATFGGDVLDAMSQDPSTAPCAGDWGALRTWPDGRVTLEAVLSRRTAFRRAVAGRESYEQVLAANADEALVVVSLAMEPDLRRLERLVALAWDSGAQPVVVLTKADLAPDADLLAEDVAAAAPGCDVLVVSVVSGARYGRAARQGRRRPHAGTARAVGRRQVHPRQRSRRCPGPRGRSRRRDRQGEAHDRTARARAAPRGRAAAGHARSAQRRARARRGGVGARVPGRRGARGAVPVRRLRARRGAGVRGARRRGVRRAPAAPAGVLAAPAARGRLGGAPHRPAAASLRSDASGSPSPSRCAATGSYDPDPRSRQGKARAARRTRCHPGPP